MDLGLPPPPGVQSMGERSRKEKRVIVLILVLVAVFGVGTCGCFAAFMAWTMHQAAGPSARMAEPWLDMLVAQDYEGAAKSAGRGVTADELRAALDRRIGAPLTHYEMVPNSAKIKMDMDADEAGTTVSYKLTGARGTATVEIEVTHDASEAGRTIGIPAWGVDPTPVAFSERPAWGESGPESTGADREPGRGAPAERGDRW